MDIIKTKKKSAERISFHGQWMGSVSSDLPLYRIIMPGSHDAGMSELCSFGGGGLAPWMIKTQSLCIYDQLCVGSRFFDLRIYMHGSVARTGHFMERKGHGTADHGCFGEHLDTLLKGVARFISKHQKTEVVILRFSHTDPDAVGVVIKQINHYLKDFLFKCKPYTNLAQVTLRELRGKVLVCCEFNKFAEFIDPFVGLHSFGPPDIGSPAAWLETCGTYNKANYSLQGMLQNATQSIHDHHSHPAGDHLGLVYWQVTGGNVHANTQNAHNALKQPGNPIHLLVKPLMMHHFPTYSDINIVMLDFVDELICGGIFMLNITIPDMEMPALPPIPQ